MVRLIDTHAHLDQIEDLTRAVRDASSVGVEGIVAVGMGYDSNQKTLEIARQYEDFIYPALGLHPWQLGQMKASEVELTLQQVEEHIEEAVAIGEIGLDYDKRVESLADREHQKTVMVKLVRLARKYDKPVLVHSRYSWMDALEVVAAAGIKRAVFHWYTGPTSVLRKIIAQGYYISATPASEYHAEHRRAVREAPILHLLLETDSPVQYGREARYISAPKDVRRSLSAVSTIKVVEEASVAEQTTENALRFFSITASP